MSDEITKEGEWAHRSDPTTQVRVSFSYVHGIASSTPNPKDSIVGVMRFHNLKGKHLGTPSLSKYDLVKLQPKPRVWYMNVYDHKHDSAYETRKEADLYEGGHRLECVKVIEELK